VQNHLNLLSSDFDLLKINNQPATQPGENFMAFLFRSQLEILIKASGDKKVLTYIVKCLIKKNLYDEKLVSGYAVFPKERKMYQELLPAFEKLYEDQGINFTFGPKLIFDTDQPTDIIVMEFLENYQMLPKFDGLDLDHVKKSLEWLAKFHAASMVYYEANGPYGDEFKEGIFAEVMENVYQPYYDGYFDYFVEAVKKLKHGERYAEKVEKWRGILFKMIVKSIKFDESSPCNVLCFGDLWSNNIMFRYEDEGKIKDVKVVDYQLSFYGTPAKDLFNFMMTSWRPDIKVREFVNLIKFYHDRLCEDLKLLNYCKTIPTLKQLNDELFKRKFLMAAMTVELLPFPLCGKVVSTSHDLNEEWYKNFYDNPRCKEIFEVIFPWLYVREALELP
jgi:Ecdysteroid kinase-like family